MPPIEHRIGRTHNADCRTRHEGGTGQTAQAAIFLVVTVRAGAEDAVRELLTDPRRRPAHRRAGRTVDFRNTVIIMTSNIGSSVCSKVSKPTAISEPAREKGMSDLRAHFRPEFLNRVDDIVMFTPQIEQIVDTQIADLR